MIRRFITRPFLLSTRGFNMIVNKEGLQTIIDKSFQQFLCYSCVLEYDSFNHMIMNSPDNHPVNISLGCYKDPCRWLISFDNSNDIEKSKPHLRRYLLTVEYMIDAVLSYESCYSLTKDIKRNQLYHFRQLTRIVERVGNGQTNSYLISERTENDGIGIHKIYGPDF